MPARSSAAWGRTDRQAAHTGAVPDAIDVLIPCYERTAELAVTLAGLAAQTEADFTVVLSDQSEDRPVWEAEAAAAMIRVLRAQGRTVTCLRNLPQQGMAHQRHTLLQHARAPRVLFLDDDVWLEPGTIRRLDAALTEYGGGFMGSAVQGLSFLDDRRPEEWQSFQPWEGPVQPEHMAADASGHDRWQLHNAANLTHIAAREALGDDDTVVYRVAWVGACVLFDRDKLLDCGGYEFWDALPTAHAGEDVLAQWRVMQRYGGAGILPSGAVHLESATMIHDRRTDAADVLPTTPR